MDPSLLLLSPCFKQRLLPFSSEVECKYWIIMFVSRLLWTRSYYRWGHGGGYMSIIAWRPLINICAEAQLLDCCCRPGKGTKGTRHVFADNAKESSWILMD